MVFINGSACPTRSTATSSLIRGSPGCLLPVEAGLPFERVRDIFSR